MRSVKLTIAYDGTDFAGWQRQASERTIQATIEDALVPIEGARVVITGAGRTDAGVHAAGQVASLTLRSQIPLDELQRALNATLPDDVRICAIEQAAAGFNARFHARRKAYRYSIYCGAVMPPLLRRYVWHISQTLDLERMNEAAAMVLGKRDFAAFQAAGSDVTDTTREMTASQVRAADENQVLVYEIIGTGFLRHMVRNIIGTLVDIGRGRRSVDEMARILESRDRSRASATAPPHGLTLWRVEY